MQTGNTRLPEAEASRSHPPAGRIDLDGRLDTVTSLVIEEGRITRIYAVRNPNKLARLGEEASLSR